MKAVLLFSLLFFCSVTQAQEIDTLKITRQDSAIVYAIELDEVIVSKEETALEAERKKLLILKRRVFKTYPYAKMTSEKLVQLNATMAKLKTNKEKKKYFKIVEKYLQEEFEPRLKKLSRKDGQILVKLIYRQTGETTFDLIKNYKSGWKAFWSSSTAKLFDINLKEDYQPFDEVEDFHIESILVTAFRQGQLVKQDPAIPIDLKELAASWRAKIEKARAQKQALETKIQD
jgi:hypothetical protein